MLCPGCVIRDCCRACSSLLLQASSASSRAPECNGSHLLSHVQRLSNCSRLRCRCLHMVAFIHNPAILMVCAGCRNGESAKIPLQSWSSTRDGAILDDFQFASPWLAELGATLTASTNIGYSRLVTNIRLQSRHRTSCYGTGTEQGWARADHHATDRWKARCSRTKPPPTLSG